MFPEIFQNFPTSCNFSKFLDEIISQLRSLQCFKGFEEIICELAGTQFFKSLDENIFELPFPTFLTSFVFPEISLNVVISCNFSNS